MELRIFQKNDFHFFRFKKFLCFMSRTTKFTPFLCPQHPNFTPFWCPWQPNFTPFQCPRQPNFTPFWCPRQPNFTPFGCPRQLLWTPLEGWGKAGAWQKVSLLKLRNTGAPSTKWGALLYCTLYTVHCTMNTVYCTVYAVHCTLYTVHCTLYTPTYLLL